MLETDLEAIAKFATENAGAVVFYTGYQYKKEMSGRTGKLVGWGQHGDMGFFLVEFYGAPYGYRPNEPFPAEYNTCYTYKRGEGLVMLLETKEIATFKISLVDTKAFPHRCPKCQSPCYLGFNVTECSNSTCQHSPKGI